MAKLTLDKTRDLSSLLDNPTQGTPLDLSLDLIDEDPEQPRQSFADDTLKELADSIRERGVKTPISVRPAGDTGRYIINHGARRFRASSLAGKTSIPAFIDTDHSSVDQLIENIQRDTLTPKEIAKAIHRLIDENGMKKTDVSKVIGKSKSYVTQYAKLLTLPEPVNAVLESGRCEDVLALNNLALAYKKNPDDVAAWIADKGNDITRASVQVLRDFLDDGGDAPDKTSEKAPKKKADDIPARAGVEGDYSASGGGSGGGSDDFQLREPREFKSPSGDAEEGDPYDPRDPHCNPFAASNGVEGGKSGADEAVESAADDLLGRDAGKPFKKPTFKVFYEGNEGQVLMKKPASEFGKVHIKMDYDGTELELDVDQIRFLGITESD